MHWSEINETNITETDTKTLVSFFYPVKEDVAFSAQCYANAKAWDVSSRKEENARKNWEAAKVRYNLILNELKSREVKRVRRDGSWS